MLEGVWEVGNATLAEEVRLLLFSVGAGACARNTLRYAWRQPLQAVGSRFGGGATAA